MALRLQQLGEQLREGLTGLAFPEGCCLCDARVELGTAYVCLRCRALGGTLDLHKLPENEMTDRFFGRLDVVRAAALVPYGKGTLAERVMRLLKYDDRPDVGYNLGGWLGSLLAGSDVFGAVDIVVPVPLHPRKLRRRGYNQAERIASGIARAFGGATICLPYAIERTRYTETQTRKSRFERISNVAEVFQLSPKHAEQLRDKHVLLVDDVMTTGATLDGMGQQVVLAQPASIKVATLALARMH